MTEFRAYGILLVSSDGPVTPDQCKEVDDG
jgi:hypothetical protein